jgi:biopolymer transport protein ExbB/TolQ
MLIERLLKVAVLGSEWVLYLLLFLSVVSIATIVERLRYFNRHSGDGDKLRAGLGKLLDRDDLAGAAKLLEGSRTVEARVAREALRWSPSGPEAMNDAVDSELQRSKKELERGLNFLGTLGNNAPFIGLFGTVLGVIMAFSALGANGQNTGAMGSVMSAIAEALVATGVGLFVAIPAVVAYNSIQKRIGEVETEAQSLTKLISAYLKAGRAVTQSSAHDEVEHEAVHAAKKSAPSNGRIEAAGAA